MLLATTAIKPITGYVVPDVTPGTAYATPDADTSAIIKSILLYNDSVVEETVELWAIPNGGSAVLATKFAECTIKPKQTWEFPSTVVLGGGGSLLAVCTTASVVSLNGAVSEFAAVD